MLTQSPSIVKEYLELRGHCSVKSVCHLVHFRGKTTLVTVNAWIEFRNSILDKVMVSTTSFKARFVCINRPCAAAGIFTSRFESALYTSATGDIKLAYRHNIIECSAWDMFVHAFARFRQRFGRHGQENPCG